MLTFFTVLEAISEVAAGKIGQHYKWTPSLI
jgi:hypothetical protein